MRHWRKCECGDVQFEVKSSVDWDLLISVHVYYCKVCGAWDVVSRPYGHPVETERRLLALVGE